ncbi:MAG: glycosyltransferase family 4 protein [Bacteroidia bacterium]|nr:glycosyltransferase family 4 protein [Bacteroidia bacterium]MCF8427293.1 glycosyltransferase family 4 protein [Bacteroidia bacterium]MCF8447871.1 glycosyltransferase family 4 protein [Bacteroidia bacterium]
MQFSPSLLIIGYVWPEPNSSAAGKRMMQLISWFKQNKYSIVFATPAQETDFMVSLESLGITCKSIALNDSSFDKFVKDLNPDLVLFDRFMMEEQFGWRVHKNCPNAIRILDTEDLHFLRNARQIDGQEGKELGFQDLQTDMAKREISSILRCDCSLIISEFEMNLLVQTFKIDPKLLLYLPIWMDTKSITSLEDFLPFEDRTDFVFIGNFWHEPNWHAVRYLKEKIWPFIRKKLPKANLQIYGAYPSQKVFDLQNTKQGFIVNGRAEDALEVITKAKVFLAPLLFGAGLKGKLLDAMLAGTPSITTQIGAEGISGEFNWPGFVENNPEEFALKAVELYTTKLLWEDCQMKGLEILRSRFSQNSFEENLKQKINYLVENIDEHRLQNFMGSILQHNSLASTKYMSKWIEVKNKLK